MKKVKRKKPKPRQKVALLSVYHKEGIVDFARALMELGWALIASGGTAKVLAEAGLLVKDVAKLSGRGPILDHRVVTLVPEIHGGLLALPKHLQELKRLGIPWIDLACVDLYPLEAEVNRPGATRESVIEKTDIGGPTMLRAGAKGRRIVVADPADRPKVIEFLKKGKEVVAWHTEEFITELAAKAEGIVTAYTLVSARYHSDGAIDGMVGTEVRRCKYGENPWQNPAGLYSVGSNDPLALDKFELIEGTDPSFINYTDIDRLLQTVTHIAAVFAVNSDVLGAVPYIAVGVKHGNACGAAVSYDYRTEAIERMLSGDPRAIFGGVVMTTFSIGELEAKTLLYALTTGGQRRLLDCVIAPSFTEAAKDVLARKGGKCRLFANAALAKLTSDSLDSSTRLRQVRGGFLRQPNYQFILRATRWDQYGELAPLQSRRADLLLAWAIGSTSTSNTITLVRSGRLIGNGVGQQDRVGAAQLAIRRATEAGHATAEAVAYSDSFFPFVDGPAALAEAGITAILASSGSVKDEEVKAFCKGKGVTLCLIPDTTGRGFFGH